MLFGAGNLLSAYGLGDLVLMRIGWSSSPGTYKPKTRDRMKTNVSWLSIHQPHN